MSEHNLHEIAPAAVAGIAAKGAKVMGAAKTAGKVAKKAAGLMSVGSEGVGTTAARVNEEVNDVLNYCVNQLIENDYVSDEYDALTMIENLSDDTLVEFVAPLLKGAAAASKVVPFVRGAAGAAKGAKAIKATGAAGAAVKGMSGGNKPDITSPDYLFKGFKTKPKEPKIAPQPKTTPTPPKPSPTKPQPEVEPTPQKDPSPDTDNPGEKNPKTPKVKSPTTTGNSTKKNQRGASMKNRTDSGSATNVGNQIKNAATGVAQGVGTAAAVGTLAAMSGKLPKLKLDTGDKIGKTKDRVSYKKQAEELEVVCDYLIDNGFADTGVQAETMYEHMTEEWKTHILNS